MLVVFLGSFDPVLVGWPWSESLVGGAGPTPSFRLAVGR